MTHELMVGVFSLQTSLGALLISRSRTARYWYFLGRRKVWHIGGAGTSEYISATFSTGRTLRFE